MVSRRFAVACAIMASPLLFCVFVVVFIPSGAMWGFVERSLYGSGYTVRAADYGKAFPLGITARQIEIGDHRGALFKADEAAVRLKLLPLLAGRTEFAFSAGIGEGNIGGVFSAGRGGSLRLEASRVRLEDLPFFATIAKVKARGELNAEGDFSGIGNRAVGKARLEVKGVELSGVRIGELPLPDATYDAVRGALEVKGGKAVLESFVLQGAGIYVRLSGELPVTSPPGNAPLNLALEMFPKPDFFDRQKLVFLLLARYMVSPGNYRIPIKGTLSHPAVP